MNILLIEDHDGYAADLLGCLRMIEHVAEPTRVADKESAVRLLQSELIDLVILDLSIPPNPHELAPTPEHGEALFHEARELQPGTPIYILTGSEVSKFCLSLAKFGNQIRPWGGSTEIETVSFFLKEDVEDLLTRVRELSAIFSNLSEIVINTRGKDVGLTPAHQRMIKMFTRRAGAEACDVSVLSGGLSDAKVIKAAALDKSGRPQALCAGKLGSRALIAQEAAAYEEHVLKLGIGAYPSAQVTIQDGVGLNGAIFYTLTDADTLSLFDRLAADPNIGVRAIVNTRHKLARWTEAATVERVSIGEIRARLLNQEDTDQIFERFELQELRELEERLVFSARSCVHGDLHCGNILVNREAGAVLIDFADAGPGFTCLDPIALELSLLFHPEAKTLNSGQKLLENVEVWPDVDNFTRGSDLAGTIMSCREWAHDVGGSDHSVLAAAYAYALRQLKYDTVDPCITIKLLKSINRCVANT